MLEILEVAKKKKACMEDRAGLPGDLKKAALLRMEIQLQNFLNHLPFEWLSRQNIQLWE